MGTRHIAITASALLLLAGCGSGSPGSAGSTAPTSTTPGSGASSASGVSGSGAATSSPAGPSSPSSASTPGSGGTRTCSTTALALSLAGSGGAAGSVYLTMRLTNRGTTSCRLHGYPGVSLVGHGNGTQLGRAAQRDTSVSPSSVTVPAGGSTPFVVRLVQAANYPSADCSPVRADGFRVYPPGSTQALFLPSANVTGCASTTVGLLTVRPVGSTL